MYKCLTLFRDNRYLLEGTCLSEEEKEEYCKVSVEMEDAQASTALNVLCQYFYRYYVEAFHIFSLKFCRIVVIMKKSVQESGDT